VELHAKPGDAVRAGQILATVHTDTPERIAAALTTLQGGVRIADETPARRPLVVERIAD
jgi:thymidine phosphorylase